MLVVQCPGCSARFKAKDELLGQTRKCPKCSAPILIEEGKTATKLVPKPAAEAPAPAESPAPAAPEPQAETPASDTVSSQISFVQSGLGAPAATDDSGSESSDDSDAHDHCKPIKKLNRTYRYVIMAKDRVTAYWKADGHGWILKTRFGNVACMKNRDQIPAQGTFVLVEIILLRADEGMHLAGLRVFKLGANRALDALSKSDDMIVSKITGTGALGREQKVAVRAFIRDQFMSAVWQDAVRVNEFLGDQDFHSCMIVEDDIDPSEV